MEKVKITKKILKELLKRANISSVSELTEAKKVAGLKVTKKELEGMIVNKEDVMNMINMNQMLDYAISFNQPLNK